VNLVPYGRFRTKPGPSRMPLEANVHWLANTCYLHSLADSEHIYKIQLTTGSEIAATRLVKQEMHEYAWTNHERASKISSPCDVSSDFSGPKETG